MGIISHPKGTKGSLKWIQEVVNIKPSLLDKPVKNFIGADKKQKIEWPSPKSEDDYAEYRDQAFVDLLGIKLVKTKLKDFWPNRGPQWDALGRIGNEAYFLVEAKAHISEIISSSQAKSPKSKTLIKKSLNRTQKYLDLRPNIDLTKDFYQYANRLAHLYLLRVLNDIPAYNAAEYALTWYLYTSSMTIRIFQLLKPNGPAHFNLCILTWAVTITNFQNMLLMYL